MALMRVADDVFLYIFVVVLSSPQLISGKFEENGLSRLNRFDGILTRWATLV